MLCVMLLLWAVDEPGWAPDFWIFLPLVLGWCDGDGVNLCTFCYLFINTDHCLWAIEWSLLPLLIIAAAASRRFRCHYSHIQTSIYTTNTWVSRDRPFSELDFRSESFGPVNQSASGALWVSDWRHREAQSPWLLWFSSTHAQTRPKGNHGTGSALLCSRPMNAANLHSHTCLRRTLFTSVLWQRRKERERNWETETEESTPRGRERHKGGEREGEMKGERERPTENGWNREKERERDAFIPKGQTTQISHFTHILVVTLWSPQGENKPRWSDVLCWRGAAHATACTCTLTDST